MTDTFKTGAREEVAYKLAEDIASQESLYNQSQPENFRQKYLDLYAECLEATSGKRLVYKK